MQRDTIALQAVTALPDNLRNTLVEGVTEANVADHTALEEGEGADALGTVDDLVGHHKVARPHFLLQTSHGAEGNDGAHADAAERGDVGAVGDLVRGELVI